MGIIAKLKSVLGVADGDHSRAREAGTPVAVEREPETEPKPKPEPEPEPEPVAEDVPPDVASEGAAGEATTGKVGPTAPDLEAATEAAGPSDEPSSEGEPVESIKGIGAAYADRLADVGVHSVEELADADAEELARATDLGPGRVGKWVDRAKARTR